MRIWIFLPDDHERQTEQFFETFFLTTFRSKQLKNIYQETIIEKQSEQKVPKNIIRKKIENKLREKNKNDIHDA